MKSNTTIRARKGIWKIFGYWELYVLFLPTFLYFVIFQYGPMYGIQLAFKNFNPILGIWGSHWTGFDQFIRFFKLYQFGRLIWNTLSISLYGLVANFPFPIILALLLNQLYSMKFKKVVQTVSYAPYFISTVVLCGMLFIFLSPSSGAVNSIIKLIGGQPIFFMGEPGTFRHLYVWSGVWQSTGYGAIIYIAALSGVNPELHEAAIVDGASRLRRIWHIDLPGIIPTIVIMFILNMGRIMSVGFEKAFLMQTPLNLETSEVISTYVYKVGLLNAQYSFSTAVGLFNSVINLILVVTVNKIAKTVSTVSLW